MRSGELRVVARTAYHAVIGMDLLPKEQKVCGQEFYDQRRDCQFVNVKISGTAFLSPTVGCFDRLRRLQTLVCYNHPVTEHDRSDSVLGFPERLCSYHGIDVLVDLKP